MERICYHTQECRGTEKLAKPVACKKDDAWFGEAFYFWETLEDSDYWGKVSKRATGKYDVFTLHLKAVGYFEISEELLENENIKEQLINTNAPAIVFPYLRSFISMFTSNLGTIPTLTLPKQFFKGKLEEFSE